MIIAGLDVSGPTNVADTVLVLFEIDARGMQLIHRISAAGDQDIFDVCGQAADRSELLAGIDAPLSYNPGGGDRPAEKVLRRVMTRTGMTSSSVMTPTMTRMAYLTLRGMALARGLENICRGTATILEVHPLGAMATAGANIEQIRNLKRDSLARDRLRDWLAAQGMHGIAGIHNPSDHDIAACGAAFAAWKWQRGRHACCVEPQPPLHPYPVTC